MDDYSSWVNIAFYVSIFLLFVFSLYKMSLEQISSKEMASLGGATKKMVEFLHASKERVNLSIGQINLLLIVVMAFTGDYIFNLVFYFSIEDNLLRDFVSLLVVMCLVITTYYVLPLMFAKWRMGVIRFFSPVVRVFLWITYPTTSLIYMFKTLAFNMEYSETINHISMEELNDAVEIVSKASTPEDKRILEGMARFANAEVTDIMCHRTDMVTVSATASYREVLDIVLDSGFSRIPVYRDVLDNIIGVLYVKDLIPYMEKDDFEWVSIIRKPYFVSDTKMISELLVKFQKKKIHLAIVVDEYGSTLGIVSLEDILEEIVGEIEDESDTEDPFYSQIDDKNYIFEGKTAISDFAQVLGIDLDDIEEVRAGAETLAGLMVELRQEMPKIGSKANLLDYVLTVVKVDNFRIDRVKVTKTDEDATDNK